jgi:hypothetical protein
MLRLVTKVISYPENEGIKSSRNVSQCLSDYTVSHAKISNLRTSRLKQMRFHLQTKQSSLKSADKFQRRLIISYVSSFVD